jgi:RNA-directed DNA polymerase
MPTANDVQGGRNDPTRALQRELYRAAKQNKDRRFHALYDKVYRTDILRRAWAEVARNGGAAGVDGVSIKTIEETGVEEFLCELARELVEERYRPQPVRRVTIPKRNGGERHLGIPAVRDRVAQAAAKLVLEPIFEADFAPCSYGFRPRRSARDARDRVRQGLWGGRHFVVDADIRSFFDEIDHGLILALVRERVSDRRIVGLVAGWLRAGVVAGRNLLHPEAGTPQGGVISPLLANIVLNRLDQAWEVRHGCLGQLTRYADDLVIVCGTARQAEEARAALETLLSDLGLSLAPTKTKLVDCRDGKEGFDFLGFHFRRVPTRRNPNRRFAATWPSKAAMAAARQHIRDLTPVERVGLPTIMVVGELNAFLQGWGAYFRYGNSTRAFRAIDNFVFERVARFNARKHGSRKWKQGMVDLIESPTRLGLYRLGGTVRNRVAHAAR